MGVPTAPLDGEGDKILFLVYDGGAGTNAAALFRAYKTATVNSTVFGEVGVYPTSGTLKHGAKAMTGGARVVIAGSTPCQGVLVRAYDDNVATIYVGGSTVTADKTAATGGYPLTPGESVGVPCRNANEVYVIGTGTDGVAWIASAD